MPGMASFEKWLFCPQSMESVIKDAIINNSSPQEPYLDTNHAKCQIQMSLNQTEP